MSLKRQQVTIVANPAGSRSSRTQLDKCVTTLRGGNVDTSPRLVGINSCMSSGTCGTTYSLLRVERRSQPATVFTFGSLNTVGICHTTQRRNVDLPRRLSVVNFSSICPTTDVYPSLAAVERPFSLVTERYVSLVLRTQRKGIKRGRFVFPARLIRHRDYMSPTHPWLDGKARGRLPQDARTCTVHL